MTARMRALVQRPHRKVHFATIAAGEQAWLTLCDREVPVDGTAHRTQDWADYATEEQLDEGAMCRQCRAYALLASFAVAEARARWEIERLELVTTTNDLYFALERRPLLAVAS